jgi:hypothetical protein
MWLRVRGVGLVVLLLAATPHAPAAGLSVVPDLLLDAPDELEPGSRAAIHAEVSEALSLATSRPVAGVSVSVSLEPSGAAPISLGSSVSDAHGAADVSFDVPDLPEGSYRLHVSAPTLVGTAERTADVTLSSTGKVLLVTDKPLYQPGQTIHLRALALSEQSAHPLTGSATFEVEDAKGNKLFKEKSELSPFGVASAEMNLAQEINLGPWTTRVTIQRPKGGAIAAQKGIEVKRYSLPKFKLAAVADRRWAEPGDPIAVDVDAQYFFGKPVQGEVKLEISLDGTKSESQTAKLDAHGKHRFEVKAMTPSGADGTISLDVAVTDTADHRETSGSLVTVSKQPLRVALVPEAGALRPGIENRLYAVVTAPDGSPQSADLSLKLGNESFAAKADETGVATFSLTPTLQGAVYLGWRNQQQQMGLPGTLSASGAHGEKGQEQVRVPILNGQPSLLARPESILVSGGTRLTVDLLADVKSEVDRAVVELWKGKQLLASKAVTLRKGGTGTAVLQVPEAGGTLELRAWASLPGGTLANDARVIYAQPKRALEVKVSADRDVYAPGEEAQIRFKVTEAGKGVPAALGLVAVDESVYAMQDIQPGLERSFFTVVTELARPEFWKSKVPPADLESTVRAGDFTAQRERLVRVLLAAADLGPAPGHLYDPKAERRAKAEGQRYALQQAIENACYQGCLVRREDQWHYKGGLRSLLEKGVKDGYLASDQLSDPMGRPWTERALIAAFPEFAPKRVARRHDAQRVPQIWQEIVAWVSQKPSRLNDWGDKLVKDARKAQGFDGFKNVAGEDYSFAELSALPGFTKSELTISVFGQSMYQTAQTLAAFATSKKAFVDRKTNTVRLPDDFLDQCLAAKCAKASQLDDPWGTRIRLVKADKQLATPYSWPLRFYRIISAGPDRAFDTADDIDLTSRYPWMLPAALQTALQLSPEDYGGIGIALGGHGMRGRGMGGGGMAFGAAVAAPMATKAMDAMAMAPRGEMEEERKVAHEPPPPADKAKDAEAAPVVRVREWFPETLFFDPQLITDEKGEALAKIPLADSITTWRLTALAAGMDGALGSAASAIRVFQDFFVDLDLPPTLTQGDEVAVPVSVYNYLKGPQKVTLSLAGGNGLDVMGDAQQAVTIGAGEVKGVSFRVKATRPGDRLFALTARGEKKSDAVRRTVLVQPNGKEVVQVVNRELGSGGSFDFDIPDNAIPDASKVFARVQPGVIAAVADGVEGLLRAPGG